MRKRWSGVTVAAALALLGACREAPAQARTAHVVHTDDGVHVEVTATGDVRFTDDDRGVAGLSPDGRLSLVEVRRGQPDRRAEYRPAPGGGVRVTYYQDGEPRAPDAAARAWMERMILRTVRDHGLDAERRVARIRAREGTAGVLREIEHIDSDGAKRIYYQELLETPGLRPDETARALEHLGRQIDSDGDKRHALAQVLRRERLAPAELAALLGAAGTIDSDGDRAGVLVEAARRDPLADARVREAFFRAARGVSSDGDLARVLVTVLRQEGLRRDAAAAALRVAQNVSSDGDRARVLVSVPAAALRDPAVRAAFQQALDGIDSDGERARVARWLASADQ